MAVRSYAMMVVLLGGCGGRSALDIGPDGEFDAGGAPDAGLATPPCVWTFGERTLVLAEPFFASGVLFAAVNGSLDEAAGFIHTPDFRAGGIVTLASPPSTVEVLPDVEWAHVYSAPGGYATFTLTTDAWFDCNVTFRDGRFVPDGLIRVTEETGCASSQRFPDRLDVAIGDERGTRVIDVDLAERSVRERSVALGSVTQIVRTAAGGAIFVYRVSARRIGLAHLSASGELTRNPDAFPGNGPFLRPDPVHGGAVGVVSDDRAWRIELYDEELTITPLTSLGRIQRLSDPVMNETEVLMMVDRRPPTLLAAPLAGGRMQRVDMPEEEEVWTAVIALRPGTSVGGVFYAAALFTEPARLWFRPLICHR